MSTMNQTETQQVATFFEGYASGFDSIYGHAEKRSGFQKLIDQLFRKTMFLRFRETLKNTANPAIESIIDIGCGPGHYCFEFLKQHKKVTGLDLSEEMLKIARKNIQALSKSDAQFIKADYLAHPFNQQFDAACLMGFFDYIRNPLDILLKLKKEIRKEIYASFPKSGGILSVQRKIRYKLRNCPLYMYSKSDLNQLMKAAGIQNFEITDCERDWFVKIKL
ncbi:MAG: methyltransferase domain-containing protein [Bacteroidetes bacterium]|nr:methyltransferase domain-containing protein [Bacteroidota bacterium]